MENTNICFTKSSGLEFSTAEYAKELRTRYTSPLQQFVNESQDTTPDSWKEGCHPLGLQYTSRLLKWLHEEFSSGRHSGTRMLDICCGQSIISTLSGSLIFPEIIMSDINLHSLAEIKKWVDGEIGALDWTCAAEFTARLENNVNSSFEIEARAKNAIKRTMQLNIHDELPSDESVLPVDCIIGILALTGTSRDRKDFTEKLQKLSRWIRPGGSILLVLVLNSDYYKLHKLRFSCANLSAEFVQESFAHANCTNVLYKVHPVPRKEGDWYYMFVSAQTASDSK